MYHPRTRVQRIEKLNFDTRTLREPGSEELETNDYIEVGPALGDEWKMGFVN